MGFLQQFGCARDDEQGGVGRLFPAGLTVNRSEGPSCRNFRVPLRTPTAVMNEAFQSASFLHLPPKFGNQQSLRLQQKVPRSGLERVSTVMQQACSSSSAMLRIFFVCCDRQSTSAIFQIKKPEAQAPGFCFLLSALVENAIKKSTFVCLAAHHAHASQCQAHQSQRTRLWNVVGRGCLVVHISDLCTATCRSTLGCSNIAAATNDAEARERFARHAEVASTVGLQRIEYGSQINAWAVH